MAIFHLSVKTFSRSKGQSATACVAYRAGAKIKCEREGRTHDYTKKGGVLHSEIFLPANAPSWANERQKLWNKAESAEKRKNSTVAREFEVALPYELNKEQRIALVQDFAKQIVGRHGCAVDAHLHDDDRRTVKANHHAHIMLTTRKLEKEGFTKKTRELDQKQSGEVSYWREQWAKTVNEHLRNNSIEKRIDHRSLKDQGLEREPTIKIGVNASALERKGIKTERGDYNRAVRAYDPDEINKHLTVQLKQVRELYNKLNFIKRRLPEIKRDIAEKQPKLYQAFDDMGIPTAPSKKIIENEQITKLTSPELVELGLFKLKTNDKNKELLLADEIEDKRQQVKSFLTLCNKQADKYHKHKLTQLRNKGETLLDDINTLKNKKPVNPLKTKIWRENLDRKIMQYEEIKAVYDENKDKGVTEEDKQAIYAFIYKQNPEAYDKIYAMDKEVKEYDEKQSQRELEQNQAQSLELRIQRQLNSSKDKSIDR